MVTASTPEGQGAGSVQQDFLYRDGVLHAEDVPFARIAEAVGTPFYCYSTAALERSYRLFAAAFADQRALVCYAIKANANLGVISTFADLGAGADVVSGGELKRALTAGVPADRIVFSGVGKTRAELAEALAAGILQFNLESEQELADLNEVATAASSVAPVAVRINPDVDAQTHDKIATGRVSDKFGIPWPEAREVYRRAAELPGIRITGIAVHIGSQLTDLAPLEAAFRSLASATEDAARRWPRDRPHRSRRRSRYPLPLRSGDRSRPRCRPYAGGIRRAGGHHDRCPRLRGDSRARPLSGG